MEHIVWHPNDPATMCQRIVEESWQRANASFTNIVRWAERAGWGQVTLGDAPFYLDYWKRCGSIAQRSLIHWLRLEDPRLCEQVEALIAKERKRGS